MHTSGQATPRAHPAQATAPAPTRSATVDEILAEARAGLDRLTVAQLAEARHNQAVPPPLVIDIRDRDDREHTGMIAGSVSIPLIVLEWRCDPASEHRHPQIHSHDQVLVTVCNQGYASSLAAVSLRRLGFEHATDLIGGVEAWAAAGLPMTNQP